ncbi:MULTISPECIES: antibiotic biosynthesis monooxygenase [Desulfitobacterium]|uniref:Antibiotic biosynthesis monooxygenase n=1 Tax=Desulfitobacterium dehalogenans (strain ATCC 51507 / DSM 9161 / JW/IU-DC1) TaxID=756499 RepID=I4AA46_DESDJ|nr:MULTISPECIES: antibiotic biosynthesis monooxygenase [Desulfitobacterium]AFM00831.1 Antibiotic biosynthesis monooxygenase [Desulfitobacterium dehalogenans ATCC 51507]
MLTIVHTFDAPDRDRLLSDIRSGLDTLEQVGGFKYASINEQTNSNEIMVMTKWENLSAYEKWAATVGENKAFKQATPQLFDIIDEKS